MEELEPSQFNAYKQQLSDYNREYYKKTGLEYCVNGQRAEAESRNKNFSPRPLVL